MNIFDLPRETLIEICSYVTFAEDLLRFEVVCKKFKAIACEILREIYITDDVPFPIIQNLLSRDLRHLRKLSLISPLLPEDEDNDWLIDRMTILSTLRNLTQLTLLFAYHGTSQISWTTKFSAVRRTLEQMTWLERLEYQYPIIEDVSTLVNHRRLTKLVFSHFTEGGVIEPPVVFRGLDQLTQVRYLALPLDSSDPVFLQYIQLTNLTALNMSYANITNGLKGRLTALVNLEKIDISGHEVSWQLLRKLPKLTSLSDDAGEELTVEKKDLNHLTQLTYLDLATNNLVPEHFSNLTNLIDLTCSVYSSTADFTNFNKLTRLSLSTPYLTLDDKLQQIRLPTNGFIKVLDIPVEINTELFNEIATLESIESLSVRYKPDESYNDLQLSRLTNLKFLEFLEVVPLGICHKLKSLPWLRKLRIQEVEDTDIDDLKVLTQLNRLEIDFRGVFIDNLRRELPYAVYILPS